MTDQSVVGRNPNLLLQVSLKPSIVQLVACLSFRSRLLLREPVQVEFSKIQSPANHCCNWFADRPCDDAIGSNNFTSAHAAFPPFKLAQTPPPKKETRWPTEQGDVRPTGFVNVELPFALLPSTIIVSSLTQSTHYYCHYTACNLLLQVEPAERHSSHYGEK